MSARKNPVTGTFQAPRTTNPVGMNIAAPVTAPNRVPVSNDVSPRPLPPSETGGPAKRRKPDGSTPSYAGTFSWNLFRESTYFSYTLAAFRRPFDRYRGGKVFGNLMHDKLKARTAEDRVIVPAFDQF
jgi:hypothetical protein